MVHVNCSAAVVAAGVFSRLGWVRKSLDLAGVQAPLFLHPPDPPSWHVGSAGTLVSLQLPCPPHPSGALACRQCRNPSPSDPLSLPPPTWLACRQCRNSVSVSIFPLFRSDVPNTSSSCESSSARPYRRYMIWKRGGGSGESVRGREGRGEGGASMEAP